MSAFQVSKGHIDRLVALALYGPSGYDRHRWDRLRWWASDPVAVTRAATDCDSYARELAAIRRDIDDTSADDAGAMLTRANLRSINARYPHTVDNPGNIPRESLSAFLPYRFPPTATAINELRPSIAEALLAIDCYEYQACEDLDWSGSEAYHFCDALRRALCQLISRDAKRGWDDWDRKPQRTAEDRA